MHETRRWRCCTWNKRHATGLWSLSFQWDVRNLQATSIQSLKIHFYIKYILIVRKPFCTDTYSIHKLSINQRCQAVDRVCDDSVGRFHCSLSVFDKLICEKKSWLPEDHHCDKTHLSWNMTCISSNSGQQAHAVRTETQWNTNPALLCLSPLCIKGIVHPKIKIIN